MALKLSRPTQTGITMEYHKIIKTDIDWLVKEARITLASYLNQEARNNNKTFIEMNIYIWSGDKFLFGFEDNIIASSYNILKTLPEFEGSEDV